MLFASISFQAQEYQMIGCFRDELHRAISGKIFGYADNTIQKCAQRAKSVGYVYFAVQSSSCFTSSDAGETYNEYGTSTTCANGMGGLFANSVYKFKGKIFKIERHNT